MHCNILKIKCPQMNQTEYSQSNTGNSFYQPPQPRAPQKALHSLLANIQSQNRQTSQQIEKHTLLLQMKHEYTNKRIEQCGHETAALNEEIGGIQKMTMQHLKECQKDDPTRDWAAEMQKSIANVITSARESQRKLLEKNCIQSHNTEISCDKIQEDVREERKLREREWEQLIDNVGETILSAEAIVESDREDMNKRMNNLETLILDLEEGSVHLIETERAVRKQEHEYLIKLIERIMDKLLS